MSSKTATKSANKGKSTNGGKKKPEEKPTAAAPTSGNTEAISASTPTDTPTDSTHRGKPDQAGYTAEQESIKKEIDQLNVSLSAVREKIGIATKSGPGAEKRNQLRAELDDIRSQQGDGKASREKIFAQLKAAQEEITRKTQELNAKRGSSQFKSTAELDAHVQKLEGRIESGTLKILDEKRLLQEINTLKRQRKTIDSFKTQQDEIDADRAMADELRKQLDDPESKARSDRYDAIKAELDALKKEGDDAASSRNVLFEERDELQKKLDVLFEKKRESSKAYRAAQDAYWAKVQEDRAKRAERAKAQRDAFENEKKKEIVERLREEASIPAFQSEIEDCQILINYFSGNASTSGPAAEVVKTDVVGVPKLNLRTVDTDMKGMVLVQDEDEEYFKPTKKTKKGGSRIAKTGEPSSDKFSVPLPKLTALASLSIPPPTNASEVPQTIENLKTKKEWLTANQERQTAENKSRAEKEIARLLASIKIDDSNAVPASSDAAAVEA